MTETLRHIIKNIDQVKTLKEAMIFLRGGRV